MELKTKLHHLSKVFKSMLEDGLIDEKGFYTKKYFELNPEQSLDTENVETPKAESVTEEIQKNEAPEQEQPKMITLSADELSDLIDAVK